MTVQAIVKRKYKTRRGRGFSREEVKEVGLSCAEALRLNIPIDARRSTEHGENVKALKVYLDQKQIGPSLNELEGAELTEVKGIGPITAGKLVGAGIKNAYALAFSTPEEIAKALSSSKDRAMNLIERARITLDRE